jgi:hypothetical protein
MGIIFRYLKALTLSVYLFILHITLCAQEMGPSSGHENPADLQLFLNGRIWHNQYGKVFGDQFFLTNSYLKGSATVNGIRYDNLDLQYDIASDELILKRESSPVIIMNKELVDSFTLSFGDSKYKIINERIDTNIIHSGYINVLYDGPSGLYVKYSKKIQPLAVDGRYDLFYEEKRIYIKKGDLFTRVENRKDIYALLNDRRKELREFVRNARSGNTRISKKDPESLIPVLRYYDSITK